MTRLEDLEPGTRFAFEGKLYRKLAWFTVGAWDVRFYGCQRTRGGVPERIAGWGSGAGVSHRFTRYKRLAWTVCDVCGLLCLRNDASARAVRRPCPGPHRLEGFHVSRTLTQKDLRE